MTTQFVLAVADYNGQLDRRLGDKVVEWLVGWGATYPIARRAADLAVRDKLRSRRTEVVYLTANELVGYLNRAMKAKAKVPVPQAS